MSDLAAFGGTPNTGGALVTTAGTYADQSPTNVVELIEAGASGGWVDSILALPLETITACAVNIFALKSGSSDYELVDTIPLPAETIAVTTATTGAPSTRTLLAKPKNLEAGEKLYAQTTVSFDIMVTTQGANI